MEPITLERWQQFSPKMRWDVLTAALRGPDQRYHMIKWFTTAVLRHALTNVLVSLIGKGPGGMVNVNLPFVILPADPKQFRETAADGQYNEVRVPCSRCSGNEPCPFCVGGHVQVIRWVAPNPQYPRIAWFDLAHFSDHIYEAATILGIPIVTIPRNSWITAMETDTIASAVSVISQVEEVKQNPELIKLLLTHVKFAGV